MANVIDKKVCVKKSTVNGGNFFSRDVHFEKKKYKSFKEWHIVGNIFV